uniref:Uncharacterized protein n=1 Tax=Anguilla anguilla TaxID=7936 RepID=A0A0E9TQ99_ANGAN
MRVRGPSRPSGSEAHR